MSAEEFDYWLAWFALKHEWREAAMKKAEQEAKSKRR